MHSYDRLDLNKFQFVKSVFMFYSILLLHVLLISMVVLLVWFMHGIVNYWIWILIGAAALITGAFLYFSRRMKRDGRQLQEMLQTPLLHGRPVEVSLLGGIASLKIGRPENAPSLAIEAGGQPPQLEDPSTLRFRELTELVRLLENDLITIEEYNKAKRDILNL